MFQDLKSRFNNINWKSKFKAFAVHIGISLAIFVVLLYLILFEWYPFPYFDTDGGIQGMRLVFFIDMVLGPTLTFVVFRLGKDGLKLDLALIGILQFVALSWGVWTIYNEHPVAVVFADDRFHPLPAHVIKSTGMKPEQLTQFGTEKIPTIFVNIPPAENHPALTQLFLESYRTNTPVYLYKKLYQKLDEQNISRIAAHSINLDEYLEQDYIKDQSPVWKKRYQEFKINNTQPDNELAYLAFFGRHGQFIIVADRKTMQFIHVLDIKPPQSTQTVITANPAPKPEASKEGIKPEQNSTIK